MSWWNPVDWVKDAWGGAVNSFDDVKHWVVHAITTAVGLVERDVLDALHLGERALGDAASFAQHEADAAVSATGQLADFVLREVGAVEQEAADLADEAYHGALVALDDVAAEGRALVATAEHTAAAALSAVVRDLVDPVVRFVEGAEGWFARHVEAWWHVVDRDVIQPIEHDLDVARHDIAEAADWIGREGAEVVRWVEHEGAELVHLAESVLGDIERVPGEVASLLSFSAVERWLQREEAELGTDIEGLATRVFG